MRGIWWLVGFGLVASLAGCGDGHAKPSTLQTYGYNEGGHQRVACCEPRSAQTKPGFASVEYPVDGAPWFDGSWHDGGDEIACLRPDKRTPVRIGYFTYPATDDAPGTTAIAWVRCEG
jgi:hypothetical protein